MSRGRILVCCEVHTSAFKARGQRGRSKDERPRDAKVAGQQKGEMTLMFQQKDERGKTLIFEEKNESGKNDARWRKPSLSPT